MASEADEIWHLGDVCAENILDERYNVANTPTANGSLFNIGPPILYRVGLRVKFPQD